MSEINVRGLAELQKFLNTLPAKVEKNIMRGALRAGLKPIKAAAMANVPVDSGALRDSIRISASRSKPGTVAVAVKAGGKTKRGNVWYAHFIEFTGAVAHQITPKLGGSLFIGGLFFKSVDHPGMKAKRFLRPALDSQSQAAVIAVGNYIKKRLANKHSLDTSDITIEGE